MSGKTMKYKGIVTGECQSLEETIFEALFIVGFIGLFAVVIVGTMYAAAQKDMKYGDITKELEPDYKTPKETLRIALFWAFVSFLSPIFIFLIFGILFMITASNKSWILPGAIVYSVPIGYFVTYNLVSAGF